MNKGVFDDMVEKWPSTVVARCEIKQFTGGALSRKTLSKYDTEGNGPRGKFILGRRVCYPINQLIEWIKSIMKECKSGN